MKLFTIILILGITVVLSIYIFLNIQKTATGKIVKISKNTILVGDKVTFFQLETPNGIYYLGIEGHEVSLGVGDVIEVTFFKHDYVARESVGGKIIGYHKVKNYRVIEKAPDESP